MGIIIRICLCLVVLIIFAEGFLDFLSKHNFYIDKSNPQELNKLKKAIALIEKRRLHKKEESDIDEEK